MKHTTKIELANRKDQFLAEAGVIKPEDIRHVTIEDAIVDTGATGVSLPKPLIEQLGLTVSSHFDILPKEVAWFSPFQKQDFQDYRMFRMCCI